MFYQPHLPTRTLVSCFAVLSGLLVGASQSQADECAYVSNCGSGSISVINTETQKVTRKLVVGGCPSTVVLSGNLIYCGDGRGNTVTVVNAVTGNIVRPLSLASRSSGIAVTPDERLLYAVEEKAAGLQDDEVEVVEASTGAVVKTIPVAGAVDVAMAPDGKFAYVGTSFVSRVVPRPFPEEDMLEISNALAVIDTHSNELVPIITDFGLVGTCGSVTECVVGPCGLSIFDPPDGPKLALTPDGKSAYMASPKIEEADNMVFVSSTTTVNPRAKSLGISADSVAVSPDGAFAYVVEYRRLHVIDISTEEVVGNFEIVGPLDSLDAHGVAIGPNGRFAYVTRTHHNCTDPFTDDVAVIDTATQSVVASIPVGLQPKQIAIADVPEGCPSTGGDLVRCVADCNNDSEVTIDELVRAVSQALNPSGFFGCATLGPRVSIGELVAAVNAALFGCAG